VGNAHKYSYNCCNASVQQKNDSAASVKGQEGNPKSVCTASLPDTTTTTTESTKQAKQLQPKLHRNATAAAHNARRHFSITILNNSIMEKVNVYNLVSEAIGDGIGNTSSQQENINNLFINGLFSDEFEEMKFEIVEGENGIEYHAKYDGHEGLGKTPALALKDLLQSVVNGLYFAENGRP
jgi:transcription elongation factor Elf1